LVHEGQIRIETLPDGRWRFLHPDGRHFEVIRCSHVPDPEPQDLEDIHAELGLQIDSDTAATRWRGERMDYDLGVWVLCNQANRARRAQEDVAAGTSDAETTDTESPDAPSPVTWPEEEEEEDDTGEWWKPGYGRRADNDPMAAVGDVSAGTSDTPPPDTASPDPDHDGSAPVGVPVEMFATEASIEQLLTMRWPDEWWWRPGYGPRPDNSAPAKVDVPAGTSDAQSPVTLPWPEEEYAGEW
jgi:hypothetical protein